MKEFFEPMVSEKKKKKKNDGFLLVSKPFSRETDLWVTLGDFTLKHAKFGRGICN